MTEFIQGTNDWWQEKAIQIRFPNCHVRLLDDELPNDPSCDFGINTHYPPYLFIELKDPGIDSSDENDSLETRNKIANDKRKFILEMTTDNFIKKKFVDAAISSKNHVQAQESEHTEFQFIALLGIHDLFETRKVNPLLSMISFRLEQLFHNEEEPELGRLAMVVDEVAWLDHFPFPLHRISETEAA